MAENKLVLRKLTENDINDLVEQGNDYDVHYYSFFLMKYPFTKEEAVEVVKEESHVKNMKRFGIELKDTKKIIGLIDLYNINLKSKKLKLGYWIGKTYRRKGYATEAIKKMIEYAFKNYDVNEIIATTLITNDASMNLLEKLGFVKGKILKNDRFLDGKYIDSVQFVLKRETIKEK
jgi:RimJ/RimL family protein N-acetyltransferase